MPSPKTVLRVSAVASFVAAFVCALLSRGASGPARELSGFLLIPFLLFLLFYIQYAVVQSVIHRDLDLRLGYLQALGCLAITLVALLVIIFPEMTGGAPPAALQENVLLLMGAFGEIVFVGNIVLTYLHQNQPATAPPAAPRPQSSPAAPPNGIRIPGFPQSPARVFGLAAAFFLVVGIVLVNVPSLKSWMPLPWGDAVFPVLAGYLWMITAVPFATFAVVYGAIEYFGDRVFTMSATRMHFICTLVTVVEGLREYLSWASDWANPSRWGGYGPASHAGVYAFALLALGTFAWNLWTSRQKLAQR